MHKEIMLSGSVSLIVSAAPGGVINVGVKSGPFLRSFSITIKKLETIVDALVDARHEAERPA